MISLLTQDTNLFESRFLTFFINDFSNLTDFERYLSILFSSDVKSWFGERILFKFMKAKSSSPCFFNQIGDSGSIKHVAQNIKETENIIFKYVRYSRLDPRTKDVRIPAFIFVSQNERKNPRFWDSVISSKYIITDITIGIPNPETAFAKVYQNAWKKIFDIEYI